MTKTFTINSKAVNVAMAIMVQLFIAMFIISNVQASGLGQAYYLEEGGYVLVKVIKEPHQSARAWGYVDEATEEDVEVGVTTQDEVFDLGMFDDESEIVFWVQGKNKRFYTGKGNCQTSDDQFIINGTKFQIHVDESHTEIAGVSKVMVAETVVADDGTDDCVDYSLDYIQGTATKAERFYKTSSDLEVLRVVMNVKSDWTKFTDSDCTAVVTLNDSCEYTYSATDEIGYFKIDSKSYEGRKLTSYDFPEGVTYLGKLRVTHEKGMDKMYVYLNNVDISDLVGETLNIKVVLYQQGEVVQAFEATKKLSEKIK